MSLFGSYSREQLRETYSQAWRKQRAAAPLTPLEAMIADVLGWHPEYHRLIEHPDKTLAHQAAQAHAAENPFLHLGLHLAVREQISIDRPPGVREVERQLQARWGDAHRAEHILMEALAETLWEAQRAGRPPDEAHYLALARRRAT